MYLHLHMYPHVIYISLRTLLLSLFTQGTIWVVLYIRVPFWGPYYNTAPNI